MNNGHLSALAIERLLAHDAALPQAARVHLDGCQICSQRLRDAAADNAVFMNTHDIRTRVDALYATIAPPRKRRRMSWSGALLPVAAAVAVTVGVAHRPSQVAVEDSSPRSDGRRKGTGLTLAVARRTADGKVDLLGPLGTASPSEAIRFGVRVPFSRYVGILGLDQAGNVTVYAPQAATLVHVASKQLVWMEDSIVLDTTLGVERIVAVACDTPRTMEQLAALARNALADAHGDPARVETIAPGCDEESLLLRKVPLVAEPR